jgi:hypothetical protein
VKYILLNSSGDAIRIIRSVEITMVIRDYGITLFKAYAFLEVIVSENNEKPLKKDGNLHIQNYTSGRDNGVILRLFFTLSV